MLAISVPSAQPAQTLLAGFLQMAQAWVGAFIVEAVQLSMRMAEIMQVKYAWAPSGNEEVVLLFAQTWKRM